MRTTLGGVMLGTRDPDRLHQWYTTVLPPDLDSREAQYRILGYGGFYLFLDPRDDVADRHPDSARTLLNFEVDDARAVVARADELGTDWLAPLEDREGSLFATALDPDGNAVQVIQLSEAERRAMASGGERGPGDLVASAAFSGYSVRDLDAAEAFYRDTLGLRVERTPRPMAMLTLDAGGRRILLYPKDDHQPATYTVLNFPVPDVREAVRALIGRGVGFLRYPGMRQDELGVHTGGGPLIAWFADPSGNVLSVIEE